MATLWSQVQRKKVTVPVPAGVEDGQTVRMSVGNSEIFVTFKVERSEYFRRDGPDVHTDCTVSFQACTSTFVYNFLQWASYTLVPTRL